MELTGKPGIIQAQIASDRNESTLLMEKAVSAVLRNFGLEKTFGVTVNTKSNIPIARGLKSSSAAANAVVLATTAALGKTLTDLDVVKIGVQAAFDAKVTVTGAFDDACASYFGGAFVTDNSKQEIVKQIPLPDDLSVVFHVPSQKAYTINSDVARLRTVKPLVQLAYDKALEGKMWEALTLNGLVYSAASNQSPTIAIDALVAGALAAGLCGKGPAVTAVVHKDKVDAVKAALQRFEGEVLHANLNCKKAKVLYP